MLVVTCCGSSLSIAAPAGEPRRSGSLAISWDLDRAARRGGPIAEGAANLRIECAQCRTPARASLALLHRIETLRAAAGGLDPVPLPVLRHKWIRAAKRAAEAEQRAVETELEAEAMTPQTADDAALWARMQAAMQHDTPNEKS